MVHVILVRQVGDGSSSGTSARRLVKIVDLDALLTGREKDRRMERRKGGNRVKSAWNSLQCMLLS